MKEMIAYCGLPCHECGAFLAKEDNDNKRRAEVAELWSKSLGTPIQTTDINCDGCLSNGGTLFRYCLSCKVRQCARERELINCAHCGEYVCAKLEMHFRVIPRSKELLAVMREAMSHSGLNRDL